MLCPVEPDTATVSFSTIGETDALWRSAVHSPWALSPMLEYSLCILLADVSGCHVRARVGEAS